MNLNINLYKDGKLEVVGLSCGKMSILAIDKDYCILKEAAYSQYVNRVSGVNYTSPQYHFYKIAKLTNYDKFINLQLDEVWVGESPKTFINDFIQFVENTYEQKKYDPLAAYPPSERKQIEEQLARQKKWMDELELHSQNLGK